VELPSERQSCPLRRPKQKQFRSDLHGVPGRRLITTGVLGFPPLHEAPGSGRGHRRRPADVLLDEVAERVDLGFVVTALSQGGLEKPRCAPALR